jgi:ribosomal protein S18 acetylase RimI-like enzyme
MKDTYGAFFSDEEMRPWIEGGETEKYAKAMLGSMLVAVEEGSIRGVVALKDDMVDLMWIALEYRGRGIGRALMKETEKALTESGTEMGRLECFEPNTQAIAFYERLGWTKKEVYLDEAAGINKVLMVKRLSE